ncbi:MAG: shikimate kinase [Pseudomonadota bacterium]
MVKTTRDISSEPRRGNEPADEAYLRLVGDRVRLQRVQRGMSRKALSHASGVSERYLAELERGTGNASLLVLRGIAAALKLRVDELASEQEHKLPELRLAIRQLEQLDAHDLGEARDLIMRRFGRPTATAVGRIALVGLRGAGKTSLGRTAAQTIGVPCVELDREVERASGMDLPEVFAVHGEDVYRRLENEALVGVVNTMPKAIITTGGGIVLSPDSYELLLSNCFVIWVTASREQLAEQARSDLGVSSPSLSPRAKQELDAAMRSREPLYSRADAVIDTTGKSAEDVLEEFITLVSSQGRHKPQPV